MVVTLDRGNENEECEAVASHMPSYGLALHSVMREKKPDDADHRHEKTLKIKLLNVRLQPCDRPMKTMTAKECLKILNKLLPSQFETVVLNFEIPRSYLHGSQTQQAIDLIHYAEQQEEGLKRLAAIIEQESAPASVADTPDISKPDQSPVTSDELKNFATKLGMSPELLTALLDIQASHQAQPDSPEMVEPQSGLSQSLLMRYQHLLARVQSLIMSLSALRQDANSDWREHWQPIEHALEHGDFQAARGLLTAFAQQSQVKADQAQEDGEAEAQEHALLATAYAHAVRGDTFMLAFKYRDAAACYQKAALCAEHTLQLQPHAYQEVWAGWLNEAGVAFYDGGRYREAEPLLQQALALRQQVLDKWDEDLAHSFNRLALLYNAEGRMAEARPLYERALPIFERAQGRNSAAAAVILNNLAEIDSAEGNYAAARKRHERALAIREQVLGAQHPDTATSLNNLAAVHKAEGRYAQALPLYERALAIREQVLGAQHPHTAQSLNNLALLHQAEGRYVQALPLYERALAIQEQILGAQHPDTAQSLNNLAGVHQDEGRYAQALPLFERALAIREQVLGAQHPDTAQSLNNLAGLHQAEGRYLEAKPLYERAITILKAVLPADHPHIRMAENNYAYLLAAMQAEAVGSDPDTPPPEPEPTAPPVKKSWWRFWKR